MRRVDFSRCTWRTLASLLLLITLIGCNDSPTPAVISSPSLTQPSIQSTPSGTWLADGVITVGETGGDTPLVAGNFVVWRNWALQAYDLAARTGFTLTDNLDVSSFIASDGKVVVWRGSEPALSSVHLYNLATRTQTTLKEASGRSELKAEELAIDGDLLYYTNASGLYLRDLRTNQERLISAGGKRPIAANGMLLWVEEVSRTADPTLTSPRETPETEEKPSSRPPSYPVRYWELHLLRSGETGRGEVLTANIPATSSLAYNIPCSYNMSGDHVVWSSEYGDYITVYNVKSRKKETIETNRQPYFDILRPLVSGNMMVWIEQATPNLRQFSIQGYNLETNMQRTIASIEAGEVHAWGIAQDESLIYTLDSNLYSIPLRPD